MDQSCEHFVGFNLSVLVFWDLTQEGDLFGRLGSFFPRQGLGLTKLSLIGA